MPDFEAYCSVSSRGGEIDGFSRAFRDRRASTRGFSYLMRVAFLALAGLAGCAANLSQSRYPVSSGLIETFVSMSLHGLALRHAGLLVSHRLRPLQPLRGSLGLVLDGTASCRRGR